MSTHPIEARIEATLIDKAMSTAAVVDDIWYAVKYDGLSLAADFCYDASVGLHRLARRVQGWADALDRRVARM